MAWIEQGLSIERLEALIKRTRHKRQIKRRDHFNLVSTILSSSVIEPGHRRQINQIFDCIRVGQVKLVD